MFRPHLTDLIDVRILQHIQDGFSAYTKMAALTTDANGTPVTKESGFTSFCADFTRKSALGFKRCNECDRLGALQTLKNGKPSVYCCHAGLIDYAAPIMIEDNFIGSFIGGQVRTSEIDEEKFTETAAELGIDPKKYMTAAKSTILMSKQEVMEAAEFLCEIAKALSELAYKNYLALQKSRKLESASRAQAVFIMDIASNTYKSLKKCVSVSEKALSRNNNYKSISSALKENLCENVEALSTIEDAIEYIKISKGEIELTENKYKVRDVFVRFINSAKALAKGRPIEFFLDVDKNVPEYLMGDSGRIGQIVNKLILNSLHYTKEGNISLKISCKKVSYASMLDIIVSDTGIGMTPDKINDVLSRLKSKSAYYPQNTENANLGFYVIGLLIKQMSGKITVDSVPEKGSVFRISLPQLEVKGVK